MGKSKFKVSGSDKRSKPVEEPKAAIHIEPKHDDDETITASNFPFNELIPDWHKFDPNTKNPATGSLFASPHHGSKGGKKISDFKTFKLACCLEFIDKQVAGTHYRVRCMNVFTVDSNQCTTHGKTTHKDGPNRIYTLMKNNKPGTWGMLKDTAAVEQDTTSLANWQLEQQRLEAAAAEVDRAVEDGEDGEAVWAAVSTELAGDARKKESTRQHCEGTMTDDEADPTIDTATQLRAALDQKAMGNGNSRKTRIRSAWKPNKLLSVSENTEQ